MEFQVIDIIILALIAGFIALRLRSTLGKDIGSKPDFDLRGKVDNENERVIHIHNPEDEMQKNQDEQREQEAIAQIDDTHVAGMMTKMRKEFPSFSVREFIEGAKGAFEWVLQAYNEKDQSTLSALMDKEVFLDFKAAIDEQEQQDHRQETTLVAIKEADIIDAQLQRDKAKITVRFVTEQIQVLRDDKGEIISGDASETLTIEDEWVFAKSLKSRDPNWTIIDT
jgi:predicted lipid-binding transport protein (Tim44 family)